MNKIGKSAPVQANRASPRQQDNAKAGSAPSQARNVQVPDKSHVRVDQVRNAPHDLVLQLPESALADTDSAEESTVESHMFAVTIDKALGGSDGHDRVVGDAIPAIINDEAGLLMDIAPGSDQGLGAQEYRTKTETHSATYESCIKVKHMLADPVTYKAQCEIMKATAITFEDGDDLYISRLLPKSENFGHVNMEIFKNPGSLEKLFHVDLICDLICHTDRHPGNVFSTGQDDPAGEAQFTLIDLDDTFGVDKYEDVIAAGNDDAKHIAIYLTAPVKFMNARAAAHLLSEQFGKVVNAAITDLDTVAYPADRIDAFVNRIEDRKTSIEANEIQVITNENDWLKIDTSDPAASLAGRIKMSAI